MGGFRIFIAPEGLTRWIESGSASITGDTVAVTGLPFGLRCGSAVLFTSQVAGDADTHELLGRVRALDDLAAAGYEHFQSSVIAGDDAYEVQEGFLLTCEGAPATRTPAPRATIAAPQRKERRPATPQPTQRREAVREPPPVKADREIDQKKAQELLTRFLLEVL